MKDRIRRIMEEQHMSQQVFADFIESSPATLSSIFNGRTRPTLNIVEAIIRKLPAINTDWLLSGTGDMYRTPNSTPEGGDHADGQQAPSPTPAVAQGVLDFGADVAPTIPQIQTAPHHESVRTTPIELRSSNTKFLDKEPRKVTEIRIYYDDQTYETFVPSKSSR